MVDELVIHSGSLMSSGPKPHLGISGAFVCDPLDNEGIDRVPGRIECLAATSCTASDRIEVEMLCGRSKLVLHQGVF